MRISSKVDYAIRATAELAAAEGRGPIKAEQIATAQGIPLRFLLNILAELRRDGLVRGRRGVEGGYELARPASEVSLADVIRAVEGPLANVHESRPEDLEYLGPAAPLREVWIAVRASLRAVLEVTTLADLVGGKLPRAVGDLVGGPDAWSARR